MDEYEPATPSQTKDKMELFRERFIYLIEIWASDHGRYQWLEKRTGIPGARWQNVMLEKQFPTVEMILSVIGYLPDHSYWLLHGMLPTNMLAAGHKAPEPDSWETFRSHREWIKKRREGKKKNQI